MTQHAFRFALVLALATTCAANAAAPTPVPGGANQMRALQGCKNQWLFNGIWRFRVTQVGTLTAADKPPGYNVTLEMRNGAKETLAPVFTGADAAKINLQLSDGNSIAVSDSTTGTLASQKLSFKDLIQGNGMTLDLPFYAEANSKPEDLKQPVKLVFPIDAKMQRGHTGHAQYAVSDPSFRVDLTCDKSA